MLWVVVIVAALIAWFLHTDLGVQVSTAASSAASGVGDNLINLAHAIYDFEDPNRDQVATRNNNPGNLKPPNAGVFWSNQTGVDGRGFAVFASLQDGFNALVQDLRVKATNHPDWTLQQLFNVWLGGGPNTAPPSSEGNAVNYAKFVADKLGVAITTTLGQIKAGV